MVIKKIKLTNFRCHESYILNCKKSTSLIVGENGCGKTSVLEAIYEATRGKSFRAVDGDILKRGADYYRVELSYLNGERVIVTYDGEKKEFLVADKKYGRLPKKNRFPVVLFLPDDLGLIGASPVRKRDTFDRFFTELVDEYSNSLSKYNKALKQRNELLKNEYARKEDLFPWDILLAKYGSVIRKWRGKLVEEINKRLTDTYRVIAQNEDEVQLKYIPQDEIVDESGYLRHLEADFTRDKLLGHTSYGVHRDNYDFYFNGKIADGSASRGEVRSVVLALKFIEADLIAEKNGCQPIVLLDDVFSELDETRQKCLVRNFKDNQVIITSVAYSEVE